MTKKPIFLILTALMLFSIFSLSSIAHWDKDNALDQSKVKMHSPQLPDQFGWDVYASYPVILADDWVCIESGYITGAHIWGSWLDDVGGEENINSLSLKVYSNVPMGEEAPYDMPGQELWNCTINHSDIEIFEPEILGEKGFMNPNTGNYLEDNHLELHQINIDNFQCPAFYQEQGEKYWFAVQINTSGSVEWGWKTSYENYNSDALWTAEIEEENPEGPTDLFWMPLFDPIETDESLDLAFVLTGAQAGFDGDVASIPEFSTYGIIGALLLIIAIAAIAITKKRRQEFF